jgi:hypothetical protein
MVAIALGFSTPVGGSPQGGTPPPQPPPGKVEASLLQVVRQNSALAKDGTEIWRIYDMTRTLGQIERG